MIEAVGLRKVYGDKVAVRDLSFTVCPGLVTGFLGPNGSGKSTTMRMILGLDRPTAGEALVDGIPYRQHRNPLGALGAMLDAGSVHPGRSAFRSLQALAVTAGVSSGRVTTVLQMVGLAEVAKKRVGGFSLGMRQRLGIAASLLADPSTVMFDEPINGLDPDGILWIRTLMKQLASEGRAVLISSHLMSEMALTADHLVVIGRGRLIADETVESFVARTPARGVTVRSPQAVELHAWVASVGGRMMPDAKGAYVVSNLTAEQIGSAAAERNIALYELTPSRGSLEDTFMQLTADAAEYHAEVLDHTGRADDSDNVEVATR